VKNEYQDIVEGSAPCETKEKTTYNSSLRAMDVEALTVLGIFALTDRKDRMMMTNLDQLAPCEGIAQNERP
jgi:hypothetical protein